MNYPFVSHGGWANSFLPIRRCSRPSVWKKIKVKKGHQISLSDCSQENCWKQAGTLQAYWWFFTMPLSRTFKYGAVIDHRPEYTHMHTHMEDKKKKRKKGTIQISVGLLPHRTPSDWGFVFVCCFIILVFQCVVFCNLFLDLLYFYTILLLYLCIVKLYKDTHRKAIGTHKIN